MEEDERQIRRPDDGDQEMVSGYEGPLPLVNDESDHGGDARGDQPSTKQAGVEENGEERVVATSSLSWLGQPSHDRGGGGERLLKQSEERSKRQRRQQWLC